MKKILLSLLVVVFICQWAWAQSSELTTFILVRHAEKGSDGTDDPDLKPEGQERAKKFASLFSNTTIDAVYSTKFKRTRNTVTPIAKAKAQDVQVYESMKPEFVDQLISKHSGKTIVVAGHSNTVPQIANVLLGKDEFQNFPDTEYGNILIVTVLKRGDGKVVRLSY
jgi:2,3-bisphosphoglycerate-dependent phosphoglycerate mutase